MSKVFINETTLTAIGDAIREKTGKGDLINPTDMPDEIRGIETGGGGYEIPDSVFILTGDCSSRFANGTMDWLIDLHSNKITTKDITSVSYMFSKSNVEDIPFELNMKNTSSTSTAAFTSMFEKASKLKNIPKINGKPRPNDMSNIFNNCEKIRNMPEDLEDYFDWSYIDADTTGYNSNRTNQFNNCKSLRSFPIGFLNHNNPKSDSYYSVYYGLFTYCNNLDEVIGLPIPRASEMKYTSNYFNNTFNYCYRLKNMTFATNEDGSPIQVNWKNQTIDLNQSIGYTAFAFYITDYNSGITADKEVKDDATYQALKNDPDWFATKIEYSRYNHDSAVATINSLPDTTISGGTNTIKFKGASGSLTDGGAINTLTAEEIAVATAKGWTVSLS